MGILQGLCSFKDNLYAAWKGITGDQRLFYAYFDGTKWWPQQQIPNVGSSVGPVLATDPTGSILYAAWKGTTGDQSLYYATFYDSSWSDQQKFPSPEGSNVGPALGTFGTVNGIFYAVWKGTTGDQSLYYAYQYYLDVASALYWSSQEQIPSPIGSCVGPALATDPNSGTLYAAWKGTTGDHRLWYASYDGSKWSQQQQFPSPIGSSVGPSLAWFGDNLYAAWKGTTGDERLWYASYDGSKWSQQQQFPSPIGSSVGPSLAVFNGKLYAMWKGTTGDHRLWYASYDGAKWSKQATVGGNTGQEVMPC